MLPRESGEFPESAEMIPGGGDPENADLFPTHNAPDFRSAYATLLETWLQTPSPPILGRPFPTLDFI